MAGLRPSSIELAREAGSGFAVLIETLERAKDAWVARSRRKALAIDGALAGVSFSIDFDDSSLADAIFLMFGGTAPRDGIARGDVAFAASIRTADAPSAWGVVVTSGSADLPLDGREFTFALSQSDGVFEASGSSRWTLLSFRGDEEPFLAYDGEVILFRTHPDWRKAIIIYLFCRLQRARQDVIFLHAGSVAIADRGILFIGPKGAGKSTVVMALAARGHRFLGDECGAYVPASRSLLPFRRPVGIKPGPRAAAIEHALPQARRVVEGEGFVRVALDELIPVDMREDGVKLHSVVFLRGFRDEAQLTRIEASRAEIAAVQPIAGSLINAPSTSRVFELVDMLAHTRVYSLNPGGPDRTAIVLEEAFTS